jgi:hypothetical protein
MDPNILKLFGRPVFSGSGRPSDYFGEPMDLGYLGGPAPSSSPMSTTITQSLTRSS